MMGELWWPAKDGDLDAKRLFFRHYSRRRYQDGRRSIKFIGPGQYMLLITRESDAIFAWRKFLDRSGQLGVNCAIFHNESRHLSSELIREAMQHAWRRWPHERLYTYVNPRKIRSSNPGYCFQQAGWGVCGRTKGGLIILAVQPQAS